MMTFFVINIMRATGTRLDPQLCALVERISLVAGQALASVCSYNFSRRRSWSLSSLFLCLCWLGLATSVHTTGAQLELFSVETETVRPGPLTLMDFIPPILFILLRLSFQICLGPFPWYRGQSLTSPATLITSLSGSMVTSCIL